jgi:TolB protein
MTSEYPRLTVRIGGQVVQQVSLKDELRIGRAPDNDVKLTDQMVSRHHALVQRREGGYLLTDLGSANGTYVRGVRLTEPYSLSQGDVFAVGGTEMLFEARDPAHADTLTAPVIVPGTTAESSGSARTERLTSRFGTENRGLLIIIAALAAIVIVVLAGVLLVTFGPGLGGQLGLGGTSTPEAEETPTAAPSETVEPGTIVEAAVTPEESPTALRAVEPEEVNDLLAQADALTWRSKFEDAIAIYGHLAEQAPEDPRPEVGWAWALILDDEASEALKHAERALELDPGSPDAEVVLARAFVDTGNEAEALTHAEKAVELDPRSANARAALAAAYMLNDELYKAVDEADLALVQDSNSASARRIRAWLYDRVDGDMGRAASELQAAAGLQPELWLRRHELGLLLLDAENYSTAIIAFQDALGIRPKAVTYSAIGESYYLLGQYDQAKASLLQALSAGAEDPETNALMGATYAHLNRCGEAQTYLDRALDADSSNEVALEAKELCEQGGGSLPPATLAPAAGSTPGSESTSGAPAPTKRASSPPPVVSGRIVFPVWNAEAGKYDSYIAQARDGSGRRIIGAEMHQPAISPDGQWVAMNGERNEGQNLFISGSNGSDLREITEHIEDGLPSWSPDSEDLAFSSTRHGDKQSRVYIIDDVFQKGAKTRSRALNFGPDDVRGEYPSWTNDGQIVYKGCDSTVTPAECGLFIIPSLGGPQTTTRLIDDANATAPAASGGRIAFMSDRDGNWEIYVMDNDGSGLERLTNNASLDGLPTWAPDGKALAFVSNQGGPWAVWAISPDGSNRTKLFEIGGGGLAYEWQSERISWGP